MLLLILILTTYLLMLVCCLELTLMIVPGITAPLPCKTEMQSLMLSAADTDAFYSHDGVSSRALMSPDVPDTDVSIHDVHWMHVC